MSSERLICIGDIHGDFEIFINVLKTCKLINSDLNWIGDKTYVVQLGDTLDGKRAGISPNKKFLDTSGEVELIKYIHHLDNQAKIDGGRVISILGNHELYPYYIGNDKKFIRDYVKKSDIKKFKKTFGIERHAFLKPGGIGASFFARTRPLLFQYGKFLFVHGSITDSLIKNNIGSDGYVDISKINDDTSRWLKGTDNVPSYLKFLDDENPVGSRAYSHTEKLGEDACKKINSQLKFFKGVSYVVMGHSSYKHINTACNGTLIRTDVALSRAFGGKISDKKIQALEILNPKTNPKIGIISKKGYTLLQE